MTTEEEIAALLISHEPVSVHGIMIRPLNMTDLFYLGHDLKAVANCLVGSLDTLVKLGTSDRIPDQQTIDILFDVFMPALPALEKMMARCLDRPLADIPFPFGPALIGKFLAQNFTGPRLKLLVALFVQVIGLARVKGQNSTEATPPSSSSTTNTTAGSSIPLSNLSSGIGDVSGANASNPPGS